MEIADFYNLARNGEKGAEQKLFQHLLVRFRFLVNCKVWNQQDAEEIVQAALMVIVKEYQSLNHDHKFEPWAYKVLNNRILSYMKARRRLDDRMAVFDTEEKVMGVNQSDGQLRNKLKICLGKVRANNRTYARILALHFQGYSTDEICRKLDMTPNNLYVALSRARTLLSKCLDGEEI